MSGRDTDPRANGGASRIADPALWRRASDLEVVETHISRVYLGPERVWKTKKPVDLGFLDFTTREARREACDAEVELNRRLAPEVYLGVVPVRRRDGDVLLGERTAGETAEDEASEDDATDWAVLMRRLPDERRADRLLEGGDLGAADLDRVADRLARFHAAARCDETTSRFGTVEAVRANVEENFEQTRGVLERYLDAEQAAELRQWQDSFLDREAERFAARIEAGKVRDGHGDLRLEHVYLDVPGLDPVVVVDCIEFNDRFRYADVCADVAFLAMDLGIHGRPDLAERFLAAYAREAQDYDLYPLVDFYESYRAFVRGKVASLVAASDDASEPVRRKSEAEARRHFLLALASERRPLVPPRLVAVGGWIASGKSTTARHAGERLDAPVLEADATRKHLVGVRGSTRLWVEPWTGPYDAETTEAVYAELFSRAESLIASGRSAVIDASFRARRHRRAARDLARRLGVPFLFVDCRADAETCRDRLRRRHEDGKAGASDGRLEIFDDFVAAYEEPEPGEFGAGELLRLDTGALDEARSAERVDERLPSLPADLA